MYGNFKKVRRIPKITAALWALVFIGLFLDSTGKDYLYGKNPGLKYFKSYSSEEYVLQPQNRGILQDYRGIIYAANDGGILEYDGVSWRSILLPNQSAALSTAMDHTGRIYVGGVNELGCLVPNRQGQLGYISLLEYLNENKRNFNCIWKTHTTKAGIFFRSSKYIFLWKPELKKMHILLESKQGENDKINGSFNCRGEYFVNQLSVGLMKLEKDSLKLIPGGDIFADVKTVFMIVPYDTSGNKLLIGTREKGFFIYDGKQMKPFVTTVDDYLKEKKVCYGIELLHSPGEIAMATLRGGLVITDIRGKLKYLFTKDFGLRDNNVKYIFEDSEGNLWAALSKGISKIEYASPLSIYDEAHFDLPGLVYSVVRHGSGLYTGTNQGLFYLAPNSDKFEPVSGMSSECWSLLSIGDSILAATSTGVFQVENNTPRKINETQSFVLLQSRQNPNRIWVGMNFTLASLYQSPIQGNGQWREEYRYEKVNRQIRTIVEDREGNLWLGAQPSGAFKVDFPGIARIADYRVTRYDTSHKLPGGEIQVFRAAGHIMFGTEKGLFRFDKEKNAFVRDHTFGKEFFSLLHDVYRLAEDRNNAIWFHARGQNYQAIPKPDHTYDLKKKSLARIPIGWQVNAIYPDPLENITWFATHEGLVRFIPGVKKDYNHEYITIIRKVSVNGTPRFYNLHTYNIKENSRSSIPVFDYRDRNLRFEFAAPFFTDETRITYSFFLEGYDNQWSDFSRESYKDFTNLDSRVHTFRVRAKNVYGQIGREAIFKFKILPPWYRTWWMYILYVLMLVLAVFLTVKWRSMKLELEKQKLERVVKERAKEIHEKNQQLEKQTLLLTEQAEKLKELDHAKSRFFANISHELRTPLTLIVGPLEHILSRSLPAKMKEKLSLMHRNSHRLLTQINRLLDLSRIDSGKMKLQAVSQDIIPFLKGILASFSQLARQNELELEFHTAENSVTLYFDAERLEEVFCNLLLNAVKFTPDGGKVTTSVKKIMEKQDVDFPSGFLEISIKDTGIGIPKEQVAHIFDRFYQVESHQRKQKGSGIGLSLARELVLLHHGKIDVHSQEGGENSGTEFILQIPLGKGHLEPGEIAPPSESKEISCPPGQRKPEQEIETENGFEEEVIFEEREKERETLKHTILVVEDNPEMRRYICESIEMDYNVAEAEDGEEGIQKAMDIMPDLVVSDIMMPKKDGYELCETLKTDFKTSHIPVILLTAKASEASVVEGLETGADDYITKPFNTKILATRIKNLIDLRSQLQKSFQRQMLLQPAEIKISSIDRRFINKLQEIIEKYISEEDFNVEALSEKMEISRVTLNKKIHALTGETATEFIRSYRLKRAMQLLKENFGNILDVALEVGFASPAYFTKCFKKKFHQLPSAFLGENGKRTADDG